MAEVLEEKSVLVVDDDPEIRMVIHDILKQHHYRVITAFNGLDAIKKSKGEKVDLILLDIRMPIFSGYWFCDAFKRRPETKGIPVIVVSALSDESDIKKAYQVGATAYVTKPFESCELLQTVEKYLTA